MVRADWEEEVRNPGPNVRGVIQNIAYLLYSELKREDAERNWYDACSVFLEYAPSEERLGRGNSRYRVPCVSLEEATTKTLELSAYWMISRNLSSSQKWERAVLYFAQRVFNCKFSDRPIV